MLFKSLKGKPNTPMQLSYWPELDVSPLLDADQANYDQSLIGVLCWAVIELSRIDIYVDAAMLSRQCTLVSGDPYIFISKMP
jgi:hypothetical protein